MIQKMVMIGEADHGARKAKIFCFWRRIFQKKISGMTCFPELLKNEHASATSSTPVVFHEKNKIKTTHNTMVRPSRPTGHSRRSESSTPRYLVLAVKIMLVLLILLLLPQFVRGVSRNSRAGRRHRRNRLQLKSLWQECLQDAECNNNNNNNPSASRGLTSIPVEENWNCLYRCLSQTCYASIYHESPLEPGEVDLPRFVEFEKCLQQELMDQKKKERMERKQQRQQTQQGA